MTARRLHVASLPPDGGPIVLDEAASRHVRVLRLRPGDRLELFDGLGRSAKARIESIGESVTCQSEPPRLTGVRHATLVLVLGLPKGSKLDECIRMATELGVHEVALMQAERSVPRWDETRAQAKLDRLTRIAVEAAAQCERADVPRIHGPRSCGELLGAFPPEARGVIFGARAEAFLEFGAIPEQVWCAVGPEGGFSDTELASFETAGFVLASLGPNILRVDTAVAAALTVIRDRVERLQPR